MSTQPAVQRYAIPVADGRLCLHFGHCQHFTMIDVAEGKIVDTTVLVPPPHEPGRLPLWLASQKVHTIIAGGMGNRAQELFNQSGITVITGAPAKAPHELVTDHLHGCLVTGANTCDH